MAVDGRNLNPDMGANTNNYFDKNDYTPFMREEEEFKKKMVGTSRVELLTPTVSR